MVLVGKIFLSSETKLKKRNLYSDSLRLRSAIESNFDFYGVLVVDSVVPHLFSTSGQDRPTWPTAKLWFAPGDSVRGRPEEIGEIWRDCKVKVRDRHWAGAFLGFWTGNQNPGRNFWVENFKLGFGLGSRFCLEFWNPTKPRTFLRVNKYLLYF